MRIPLKHSGHALIDVADYPLVQGYRWRKNQHGYAVSHRMVDGKVKTVFMHRLVNQTPEGEITDHINQDKLDNRRVNLRTASKSLNSLNSKTHSRNRSGFRGVSKVGRRWRAAIVLHGRQEHLGYFDSPEEAAAAYAGRLAKVAVA